MAIDCHIHMVLDGENWKTAIARHDPAPQETFVRAMLARYRELGYTYLRDGGDRWGAGALASRLAPQYGIEYATPLAPLCKRGHYGGFIGRCYDSLKEYAALVKEQKAQGADFIKIMISGLMDFNRFGVLTEEGLPAGEIHQLIDIAHEQGMSVMAHANGTPTVIAAAEAGVDSVEHGAYLSDEALWAMKEKGAVWVPTLSTVGNLRGKGRFRQEAVQAILQSALENVNAFYKMGGLIAPGTDAGAWQVPHGSATEQALMTLAGVEETALCRGGKAIMDKFPGK